MIRIVAIVMCSIVLFSCTRTNVKERPQYKTIFDKYKVNGTFAAYDNVYDENSIYNLDRFRDSSYCPASTFKILNSLIGLETGAIVKNEKVKWDGKPKAFKTWEKDMTFDEAFKASCVWYFQDVARKIGKDTMQRYLDSISYGTKKITTSIDSFWLDNSLKIKADEQLGLLKKLYFKQLNKYFSNRTMDAVKDAMLMEKTDKYGLYYKTGLGFNDAGNPLGWIMGWVEFTGPKPKVNFFLLNVDGKMDVQQMMDLRKPMLMELLKEEKVIVN
jgi:beta-lactamase class D